MQIFHWMFSVCRVAYYPTTQDPSANKRENFLSAIGLIIHYIILRNGIEHFRGTEMSFTDTSGVQPYQEYSYQLRACTVAGCTDSSKVSEVGFVETGARILSASVATLKCFQEGVIWRHTDYWVNKKNHQYSDLDSATDTWIFGTPCWYKQTKEQSSISVLAKLKLHCRNWCLLKRKLYMAEIE